MKGVILAGGMGKRMLPLTKEDNKHYLPVFNQRMVEIPLRTLVTAGVKDIILVTGGNRPGQFLELLRNGKDYGLNRLYYTYQEGSGGIADALSLARPFVGDNEDIVVILGDNYFEHGIKIPEHKAGCHLFLQQTLTPWDFGIVELNQSKQIIGIEEKPKIPKSDLAATGCYIFDSNVWTAIDSIAPSSRGELEVTDVIRWYLPSVTYTEYTAYWSDMGTFDNWNMVSRRVAKGKWSL